MAYIEKITALIAKAEKHSRRFCDQQNDCNSCRCKHFGMHCLESLWAECLLSNDIVPVVRCKDCRHFKHNLENDTYCDRVVGLADPKEYDFCSYGEPKEGAE